MEVTKKEEQRENKEVKRPQIDPAIIEELMKGCSVVRRPPVSWKWRTSHQLSYISHNQSAKGRRLDHVGHTHTIRTGRLPCAVSLMGAGTNTTGVVRCDQPRALDLALPAGAASSSFIMWLIAVAW